MVLIGGLPKVFAPIIRPV